MSSNIDARPRAAPPAPPGRPGFLAGEGEMPGRIWAFDWTATPLGPIADWPAGIRALLSQVLASPMPTKLVWGPALTQIYNDAYIPVLGHKHPAALGVPMRASSPEIWAASMPVYDQALRDGRGVFETDRPVDIAQTDGTLERRLFTVGYAPVRGDDGAVAGVVVSLLETTGRTRAEAALTESRERLNQIVEHADVGILQTDMQSRILVANRHFCALLGRSEAELRQRTVADITHPDDVADNMAAFAAMLRTGRPFALEKRYLHADGGVVWVSNNVSLTAAAPGGGAAFAISIVRDITERKLAQELTDRRVEERTRALAASESRARMLFVNTPDLRTILREERPGRFVFVDVNPSVVEGLGQAREEIIGKSVEEFYGEAVGGEVRGHLTRATLSDAPIHYQSNRIVQGASRWFENTVFRMPDAGGGFLVVSSSRDVTEARLIEEQLQQAQKMEAVGQLTSGISHDFNNLLTAITGNLELIERKSTDPDARRRAANAMRAARRGAELTAQLLAFSRKQLLSLGPIDLNDVVTGMGDLLARTMGGRVEVRTELAAGLPTAMADAAQIETALLNLAINARDAMPDGGVVTLRTEALEPGVEATSVGPVPAEFAGRPAVLVSVGDTGTGMSPEVLARAFEPFFTTKPVGKGSGLGLSMVYGVTKQSGGALVIASAPGEGTRVGMFLPVVQP